MNNNNKATAAKAYGHGHGHGHGDTPYCCFHPRETVVGVCAHCLKDRLLLLLSTSTKTKNDNADACTLRRRKTSSISLPKQVLASFLQRLDSRPQHTDMEYMDYSVDSASVASLDDSFISIKFEDNGKATWDSHKQQAAAMTMNVKAESTGELRSSSSSTVVLLEHVKRGGVTRWRKQVVGRLLQLARWKRSAVKAGGTAACHVGLSLDAKKAAADRSKARGRGWIRSLTRRRAAVAHGERPWS